MPVRPDSVAAADDLAAALQNRILVGDYPVGTRLRQELLAAEFGVSRMPVREALHKLEALGLVEITPRRGAFIRGPSTEEIREAYVVRAELEGLAAELAARPSSTTPGCRPCVTRRHCFTRRSTRLPPGRLARRRGPRRTTGSTRRS